MCYGSANAINVRGGCMWMYGEIWVSGRKGNFVTTPPTRISLLMLRGWVHLGEVWAYCVAFRKSEHIGLLEVRQQETYQLWIRDSRISPRNVIVCSLITIRFTFMYVRALSRISCIVESTDCVQRYWITQNCVNVIFYCRSLFTHEVLICWPPLWSSGQSFWLSRVRFPALQFFFRSRGSGTWCTMPREDNWGATGIKK
jgi:hypothetical protein